MPAPPPDPHPTTPPPFRPRQPHQRRAPLLRHPDQRPRATPHLRQSHQPRPDLPAHRFPPVIASSTPAPMPRTPPPRADGLRIRAATPRSAPPCPVLPEHDLPAPRLRGSPSPARPAVLSAPRAATPAPAPKAWGPGSKLRRPRPVSARRPPFSVPKYPGGRRHRRRGAAPPCLPRQRPRAMTDTPRPGLPGAAPSQRPTPHFPSANIPGGAATGGGGQRPLPRSPQEPRHG